MHLNEWEPIILESNIAQVKGNRKITQNAIHKKNGLISIYRVEKRMPQEKYVIIKEVPYIVRGTSLLIYLCSGPNNYGQFNSLQYLKF